MVVENGQHESTLAHAARAGSGSRQGGEGARLLHVLPGLAPMQTQPAEPNLAAQTENTGS